MICLLSTVFYSCGSTTSNTSPRSYEIGPLPSASKYREREILAAIVAIGLTVLIVYIVAEAGKKATKKQNAIMESWKGAHITRLIRSWGPPQEITSDGGNGKIYIWTRPVDIRLAPGSIKRKRTYTYGGYTERTQVKPPVRIKYDRVRMFWIDSQGIVYHWKWKGL